MANIKVLFDDSTGGKYFHEYFKLYQEDFSNQCLELSRVPVVGEEIYRFEHEWRVTKVRHTVREEDGSDAYVFVEFVTTDFE